MLLPCLLPVNNGVIRNPDETISKEKTNRLRLGVPRTRWTNRARAGSTITAIRFLRYIHRVSEAFRTFFIVPADCGARSRKRIKLRGPQVCRSRVLLNKGAYRSDRIIVTTWCRRTGVSLDCAPVEKSRVLADQRRKSYDQRSMAGMVGRRGKRVLGQWSRRRWPRRYSNITLYIIIMTCFFFVPCSILIVHAAGCVTNELYFFTPYAHRFPIVAVSPSWRHKHYGFVVCLLFSRTEPE